MKQIQPTQYKPMRLLLETLQTTWPFFFRKYNREKAGLQLIEQEISALNYLVVAFVYFSQDNVSNGCAKLADTH